MHMTLAPERMQEILGYVMQNYFSNTRIEGMFWNIWRNSIVGIISHTKDICKHLEQKNIITSTGAVRGTICEFAKKLFKYQGENSHHDFILFFPSILQKRIFAQI